MNKNYNVSSLTDTFPPAKRLCNIDRLGIFCHNQCAMIKHLHSRCVSLLFSYEMFSANDDINRSSFARHVHPRAPTSQQTTAHQY
jgi:hypothetical protein